MVEARTGSVTLVHTLDLELRLVGIGIGCLIAAYPFLKSHSGEALAPVLAAAWIAGGAALAILFALGNSTTLTVDEGEVTVRTRGPLGRTRKVLPASAVESVTVMTLPSRRLVQYCVAVKVKNRRQLFMGDSHRDRETAEAEQKSLVQALGRAV